MEKVEQCARATRFRELHHRASPLLLPNAWDVVSAKMFERSGCEAIGTTSAGIAASMGYADGEKVDFDEMLRVIGRIVASVKVPVSADIESGYGDTLDEVIATAKSVISAGVVGINIEDGTGNESQPLHDLENQAKKIQAIRDAAIFSGVPMFINARTDVFWCAVGPLHLRVSEAVRRAVAYERAGADCIFIPGVVDLEAIEELVSQIALPINVLASQGTPNASVLAQIGVGSGGGIGRISSGSGPYRASISSLQHIGEQFLRDGTYSSFTEDIISYSELKGLLED